VLPTGQSETRDGVGEDHSDRVRHSEFCEDQRLGSTCWPVGLHTEVLGRRILRQDSEREGFAEKGIAILPHACVGYRLRSSIARCETGQVAQGQVEGRSWSGATSWKISVDFEQQPYKAERSARVKNED
jgi:hypothetical protein